MNDVLTKNTQEQVNVYSAQFATYNEHNFIDIVITCDSTR